MYNYKELIGLTKLQSKPIKLTNTIPVNIFKTNKPLLLSHCVYKFLQAQYIPEISSIIHKPLEVTKIEYNQEFDLGVFRCRLYNSTNIYSVLYIAETSRMLSSTSFTSSIVYAYDLFSTLFVKCKIRFISKTPHYIVYESPHIPDIIVSFRDIISRYGITNDNLYKKRLNKIYQGEIKRQQQEIINEEDQVELNVELPPSEEKIMKNLMKYKNSKKEKKYKIFNIEIED